MKRSFTGAGWFWALYLAACLSGVWMVLLLIRGGGQ